MSEEEKNAIESLKIKAEFIGDNYSFGTQGIIILKNDLKILLNLIENQQKELNSLKEIEQLHKEENGKLRVELEQEKEKNKELEKDNKNLNILLDVKNKDVTYMLLNYISKDKIKEMMKYREFELQQEYKEFEEDVEWRIYKKILEDR